MTKLKKKQIRYFQERVDHWINGFGLSEWQVWKESQDLEDAYGQCQADLNGKTAIIVINPLWDYEPKDADLDRVAFHEVCELLLWPLHHIASERFVSENEWESQRHTVIRRLENAIL